MTGGSRSTATVMRFAAKRSILYPAPSPKDPGRNPERRRPASVVARSGPEEHLKGDAS